MKSLSHVQLFTTPQTSVYQAPPSKGFSRQEYWSGLPLPFPRILEARSYNFKCDLGTTPKVLHVFSSFCKTADVVQPKYPVKIFSCRADLTCFKSHYNITFLKSNVERPYILIKCIQRADDSPYMTETKLAYGGCFW